MTALNSLMDQARGSPRRSEHSSTVGKSTTQSRHSERSQHSAIAAQAQLEALDGDDRTSRAKIESRGEKNLFKMTGQVPPTPIASECYLKYASDHTQIADIDRFGRSRRGHHPPPRLARAVSGGQHGEESRDSRASEEPEEEALWHASSDLW
jgi:hypothetical protein